MTFFNINTKILLLSKNILNKNIFLVYFFSLFFYFPPTWIYFDSEVANARLDLMMQQAYNPFNIVYDNIHNVLAYRVIVPTFNHFFGLRGFWIIIPSLLGAYFLLLFSLKIFEKHHNRLNSFLFILSISTSYLFVSGTNFWDGNDSLAIATVLFIVLLKPIWIQWILIFLAISFDERSLFSILILPLLIKIYQEKKIISLKEVFFYYLKWTPGFISALFLRFLISNGIIFPAPIEHYQYNAIAKLMTSTESFHPRNIAYVLTQWFLSIRWLWFYVIYFLIDLLIDFVNSAKKENKFNHSNLNFISILYFLTLLFCYLLSNLFVGDVWRCALYLFPFLYSSILMIRGSEKSVSSISAALFFLMLITPQFYLGGFNNINTNVNLNFSYPFPLHLIRSIL